MEGGKGMRKEVGKDGKERKGEGKRGTEEGRRD